MRSISILVTSIALVACTTTAAEQPIRSPKKEAEFAKLIEGKARVSGEKVAVRQGALDRTFAKEEVLYVAESRDEIRLILNPTQLAEFERTGIAKIEGVFTAD